MQVRNEADGNDICDQLRAAGIKCAVEPLPDANSFASIWAIPAPTVLMVLVNASDLDNARAVIREHLEDGSTLEG
jgi:cell division septation protein DedD